MMESNDPIATWTGPWGIPIQIQPSIFFLLFIFVGFSVGSAAELVDSLIFFGIVMGSILAHEFGHAWGARVQGIPVLRVVLYGGGGFCQHRSAGAWASELIVIMGPLVNLALWALLSLGSHVVWSSVPDTATDAPGALAAYGARMEFGYWLWLAADINLVLFFLNMIPVQPLDGGKLLHLWLLRFLRQDHAMQIAGAVGLVFAVLWVPAMILVYFGFGFLLLFLPSIRMHWEMVRTRSRLRRIDR